MIGWLTGVRQVQEFSPLNLTAQYEATWVKRSMVKPVITKRTVPVGAVCSTLLYQALPSSAVCAFLQKTIRSLQISSRLPFKQKTPGWHLPSQNERQRTTSRWLEGKGNFENTQKKHKRNLVFFFLSWQYKLERRHYETNYMWNVKKEGGKSKNNHRMKVN